MECVICVYRGVAQRKTIAHLRVRKYSQWTKEKYLGFLHYMGIAASWSCDLDFSDISVLRPFQHRSLVHLNGKHFKMSFKGKILQGMGRKTEY